MPSRSDSSYVIRSERVVVPGISMHGAAAVRLALFKDVSGSSSVAQHSYYVHSNHSRNVYATDRRKRTEAWLTKMKRSRSNVRSKARANRLLPRMETNTARLRPSQGRYAL